MTIGAEAEAEEERRGGAEVEAAGAEAEAEAEVEGGGDASSGSAAAAAAAAAPLPLETAVVFFRNVISILLSSSRLNPGGGNAFLSCAIFGFQRGRASSGGQRRKFRSLCLGCDAPKKSSHLSFAVTEVFPYASRHSNCVDPGCISSRSLRNKSH